MSKADELKSKNENLFERNTILLNENERLKKENAELKESLKKWKDAIYADVENYNDQLTKAKDLIKNIIRITWGEGWNYSLDWKVKAEQFLKEIEK